MADQTVELMVDKKVGKSAEVKVVRSAVRMGGTMVATSGGKMVAMMVVYSAV